MLNCLEEGQAINMKINQSVSHLALYLSIVAQMLKIWTLRPRDEIDSNAKNNIFEHVYDARFK